MMIYPMLFGLSWMISNMLTSRFITFLKFFMRTSTFSYQSFVQWIVDRFTHRGSLLRSDVASNIIIGNSGVLITISQNLKGWELPLRSLLFWCIPTIQNNFRIPLKMSQSVCGLVRCREGMTRIPDNATFEDLQGSVDAFAGMFKSYIRHIDLRLLSF